MVSEDVYGAEIFRRQKNLYRVRGCAAGRGGVSQWQITGHEQNGIHSFRF